MEVVTTESRRGKLTSLYILNLEVARLETTRYNNRHITVCFPELVSPLAVRACNTLFKQEYGLEPFSHRYKKLFIKGVLNEKGFSKVSVGTKELEINKWYSALLFNSPEPLTTQAATV